MAQEDQVFTAAADLGSTPAQLAKLKELFVSVAGGIEKFLSVTVKLDADSKRLEVAFEGITASFEKLKASLSVGPRGGVEGLAQFTKAAEQLINVQQTLRDQAAKSGTSVTVIDSATAAQGFQLLTTASQQFQAQIQLMVASVGQLQQAIAGLAQAQNAESAADTRRTESLRNKLRERQKEIDLQLQARKLGAVSPNVSAFESSQIETQRAVIARQLAASNIPALGGFGKVLTDAFDQAKSGAIDTTTVTGRLAAEVKILIDLYAQTGAAAQRAADRATRGSKAAQDAHVQEFQAAQKQLAIERERQAQQQRNQQSAALGATLRQQFLPAGADTTSPRFDVLEAAIKRFEDAARKSRFPLDDVLRVIQEIGQGGPVSFEGVNAKLTSLFGTVIRTSQALNKMNRAINVIPIQEQIAVATAAMQQLAAQFSKPLADLKLPTDKIDTFIQKLGIATRDAGISKERFQELFKATQTSGGLLPLENLTTAEARIIRLIQRIDELSKRAVSGSKASADAQAQYNARLQAAHPVIQQIITALSKQFGSITDVSRFQQLQSALNSLSKAIGNGTISAQQLLTVFEKLKSSGLAGGGGGGGKPPALLSPGAGGEAQSQLLRLISLFDQAEKKSKGLLLSLDSIFRLFQVQVLHQVLGGLITDFRQATDAAQQFQIKISEIRTISQENQLTTSAWARGLRELSDSFGLPILDVVKASYDAISNQVAKGAQTFEFLRTTLEFSRITVSSAADAQNLLSSAVKSYGEKNLTAQKAAEVLFKTIDLGRVTASELANTFGRVAQLSALVGISIEELGAAISTLTVRGVRYSEAYTLVNNVVLKLLKPTEAGNALFQKWGVTTGEAAIQTFGFVGVLRLLQRELQTGGLSGLAEIEQNIRAIKGALGLVSGDAFADFENNLQKIGKGGEQFAKAGDIIRESPAFKLQVELNKIKNLLAVDFGQKFIQTILDLTVPFGGLSSVVKTVVVLVNDLLTAVKLLVQPVLQLGTAVLGLFPGNVLDTLRNLIQLFVSYRAAILLVQAATALYGVTLGPLIAGIKSLVVAKTGAIAAAKAMVAADLRAISVGNLVTIGLTALIFTYVNLAAAADARLASIEKEIDAQQRLTKETEAQKFAKERQTGVDTFNKDLDKSFRVANLAIAAATASLTKFLNSLREVNRVGIGDLIREAESVFKFVEGKQKSLEEFVKAVGKEIETSEKRIIALRNQDKNRKFEQGLIGLSDIEQAIAVAVEAKKIREELSATAIISPDVLEDARKSYEELNKLLEKYINQLTSAIKQQQKLIADLGVRAETRAFERSLVDQNPIKQTDLTLARTDILKQQAIELFNNNQLEESRKKFEEIDKLLEKIFERQKSFREKAQKLGVVFSTPLVGGPTDKRLGENDQTRLGLEKGRLSNLFTQQQNLGSLQRSTVQEAIGLEKQYQAAQRTRLDEAIQKQRQVNDLQKISQELLQSRTNIADLNAQALKAREDAKTAISQNVGQIEDALKTRLKDSDTGVGEFLFKPGTAQKFRDVRNDIKAVQEALDNLKIRPDAGNIDAFEKRLRDLGPSLRAAFQQQFGFGPELNKAQEGIGAFIRLMLERSQAINAAREDLIRAELDIKDARRGGNVIETRIQTIAEDPAVKALVGQFNLKLEGGVQDIQDFNVKFNAQLNVFSNAFDRLISILQQIDPNAKGADKPRGFSLGGVAPTDTRLVWTNPGEFIMNAQSSNRFAPQLRSMNMGFEPKFNSTSNSSSVNVGDIHVTVQGGKTNTASARELANEIRREIRRGTIKR